MSPEPRRPDPDALLKHVAAEDQRPGRGQLKIFLGYVAGVGKTFTMLEAARQRQAEGLDVVVGYIETHGRKETDALLEGLEILPRRVVEYRGTTLSDLDLDAVLARRPRIVLVDELAHTNAPGLRHPRRYLDVEEILTAGIDVYTTVNIQHLESLNDVIQQITGILVRETVPDRLIDEAEDIELVDLPPVELQQRLRDGKIYVSEQAARAIDKFFRTGNLTALRELALRRAADRVDSQMLSYMQTRAIPGPWPAGERILVAISSHPMGERLIRTGRRLADDLNAEWTVMFVETSGHLSMPPESRLRIQRYLRLAEELGASVVNLVGESVAQTMIEYAREHNITKIVAGKPLRPRWFEFFRGSVIDQIIRASGNIDVFVVSEETEEPVRPPDPLPALKRRRWRRYLASLAIVVAFTLLGFPLRGFLDPANLVMVYLAAVVIIAVYFGRGPSILASFLGVLLFDFFFVDPRLSFTVNDTQYLLTFIGLLLVGLIISSSAARLREQVDALRRRDRHTQAINRMSRELTGASSLSEVLELVIRNVADAIQYRSAIFLPQGEQIQLAALSPDLEVDENEQAVADWCFRNGQPAGRGTDTLPSSGFRFQPLKTARGTVGVLGVRPLDPEQELNTDQRLLMAAYANLAALAIERALFAEKAAQSEVLRSAEKLQSALLNSISHELRTPLASITGVLTSLGESEQAGAELEQLDAQTRVELIDSATLQAQRLNRLVENLLNMTRLEAGGLRLHLQPVDFQDLANTVLDQSAAGLAGRALEVSAPPELPLLQGDPLLVAQVLANLVDNACKYAPPGSPIHIAAEAQPGQVEVTVRDEGRGVQPADLERIFDKFYRVQREAHIGGTGLGLSICRGIIEAHGGRIWAENLPAGGFAVRFTLPLTPDQGGQA